MDADQAHEKLPSVGKRLRTWLSGAQWTERVITFHLSWFAVTMGTGGAYEASFYYAYSAQWLKNLGYCFWILDIVLYSFFLAMTCMRFILFPRVARSAVNDINQVSFLGPPIISLSSIILGIVSFYPSSSAAVWVAWGFWLFTVTASICTCCTALIVTSALQKPKDLSSVSPAWLLVFVSFIFESAVGAQISQYLPAPVAAATLIISFASWSVGISLAHLILGIFLCRLTTCPLPPGDAIISFFIPVGPAAMGSYSIQLMATSTSAVLRKTGFLFALPAADQPYYSSNSSEIVPVSEIIHWLGFLMGLFLVGEATVWLLAAVTAVCIRPPKSFNTGTWAMVFPLAVYSLALERLASNLRNSGFKGLAAAAATITLLTWLGCALATVYKSVWMAKGEVTGGIEGQKEREALKKVRAKRPQASMMERGQSDASNAEKEPA